MLTFWTEEYHSTPETQTDESYTHPEDLEHFAHHEEIERKEAEREAIFQGISVEEALRAHEAAGEPPATPQDEAQAPIGGDPASPPKPKITRVAPPEKQEPEVKFKDAKTEGTRKGEWGTGEGGYKSPTNSGDKMRYVCIIVLKISFHMVVPEKIFLTR